VPTTFRAKLFSGLTGTKRRRRQSPTDATVSIPADHDDRNPTTTASSHRADAIGDHLNFFQKLTVQP